MTCFEVIIRDSFKTGPVLKQVVTCRAVTTAGIDGVYGKGNEIVRIGEVREAVHAVGEPVRIPPISRTLP